MTHMATEIGHRTVSAVLGATLLLLTLSAVRANDVDAELRALYAPFQQLLERHLEERDLPSGGLVTAFDYDAAFSHPETADLLGRQNALLADFDPDTLTAREEAIAFWLNAYNYFMVAYLLENPRRGELVDSVRDYGNLFNPYRVFRREVFEIGGKRYSLDDMEKGILLGDEYRERGWKEARVHFAVNCASVGCPPLRKDLYLPSTLDDVLTENTRRALLTERHLHADGETLYLTSLFDWYEEDYVEEAGSVRDFIRRYATDEVCAKLDRTTRIRFIDYDWDLNSPANFPEFR